MRRRLELPESWEMFGCYETRRTVNEERESSAQDHTRKELWSYENPEPVHQAVAAMQGDDRVV